MCQAALFSLDPVTLPKRAWEEFGIPCHRPCGVSLSLPNCKPGLSVPIIQRVMSPSLTLNWLAPSSIKVSSVILQPLQVKHVIPTVTIRLPSPGAPRVLPRLPRLLPICLALRQPSLVTRNAFTKLATWQAHATNWPTMPVGCGTCLIRNCSPILTLVILRTFRGKLSTRRPRCAHC